jgi:hypothetical protein
MFRDDQLIDQLAALWNSDCLNPNALPDIATHLLVLEIDSPALRELAGLDLGPLAEFDASDLFKDVLSELGAREQPKVERLQRVSAILAHRCLANVDPERLTTHRFYRLAVRENYPSEPPEIMLMFYRDDFWDDGIYTLVDQTTAVRSIASELLQRLDLLDWKPDQLMEQGILVS